MCCAAGTATIDTLVVSTDLTATLVLSVGEPNVGGDFLAYGATSPNELRWNAAANALSVTALATTITSPLTVTGATSVTGTFGVTGATTLTGAVGVTGALTIGAANAGHNVLFNGAIFESLPGSLQWTPASNRLTVTGSVVVNGAHTVTGASTINGAVAVNGALSTTGAATLNAGATVLGDSLVVGSNAEPQALRVFGFNDTSLVFTLGTLTVDSDLTATGDAAFAGDVAVTGTLSATGPVALSSTVQIDDALTVGASGAGHTVRFHGATVGSSAEWIASTNTFTVNGLAAVTGTVSIGGAAMVSGLLSANLGLAVSGGATALAGGSVDVDLAAGQTFTVQGTSGSVVISDTSSLTVTGTATVTGSVALQSTASVTGLLSANGGIAVTGSAALAATTVSSTLTVTGATTLNDPTTLTDTLTVGADGSGHIVRMYGVAPSSALTWAANVNTLQVVGKVEVSDVLNAKGTMLVDGASTYKSSLTFDTASTALALNNANAGDHRLTCITINKRLGFCESKTACTTCTAIA